MAASVKELIGEINFDLPWFLADPGKAARSYLTAPWIIMDFETTNLEKGNALNPNNELVCAAWALSDDRTINYHRGNEFDQHQLLRDTERILASGGFIIAHNAKFELHWLSIT